MSGLMTAKYLGLPSHSTEPGPVVGGRQLAGGVLFFCSNDYVEFRRMHTQIEQRITTGCQWTTMADPADGQMQRCKGNQEEEFAAGCRAIPTQFLKIFEKPGDESDECSDALDAAIDVKKRNGRLPRRGQAPSTHLDLY